MPASLGILVGAWVWTPRQSTTATRIVCQSPTDVGSNTQRGLTVLPRKRPQHRWLLGCLATFILAAVPGQSAGQSTAPQQQIGDVEKQIEALNKRLAELRKTNGAAAPATQPASDPALDPNWIKALNWRSIGPAAMGGRITGLAVCETDPTTYFVATASGGLLKTENNGVTFVHQFDRESTVSIG